MGGCVSAPPAPTSIAPIIAQWMDFADDDTEGQEFAQAVASAIWDALCKQGAIGWAEPYDEAYLIHAFPPEKPDDPAQLRVLVLPLAGLDTDTPT